MPHAVMGCKLPRVALVFWLFHIFLVVSALSYTFESEPPLTRHHAGDDVTMEWTLSSDPGPFSSSSFFNENNVRIILRTHGGGDTIGPGYDGRVSFYSTSSRGTGFRLTDVTPDDAGRYRCRYEPATETTIDSSSVLFIFDEPSTPKISLTGELKDGDNVTLRCAASSTSLPEADRPAMTYTWTRNGQPIDRDTPPDRHSVPNVTGRRLDISPVSRDDVIYSCTAREEGSNLDSQTTRDLNVLYPPSAATAPDPLPPPVVQGISLTVTCTLSDRGNPPASVVYRSPQEQFSTVTDSLVIPAVTLERDDGTWGCYGTNTAGTAREAQFDITVYVPPRVDQNLTATKTIDITQTLSVSCSFEGRPEPAIEWTYGGSAVLPDAVETVPGATSTKGKLVTSSSTLQWKTASDAKRRLAGGVYQCTATNAAGTVTSQEMTLNTQYAPYSVTVTPSTSVTTVEGERLELEGSADCNPSCQYSWTLNGDSLTQDTSGRLQIDSIRRDKHGTYSLRYYNDLGGLTENVVVTVNYPPTVTMTIDPEDGLQGNKVEILCQVDSRTPSEVTWTNLTSSGIPRGTLSGGEQQHHLTLDPADCLDSGIIRCTADNGLTPTNSTQMELNVFCPPRLDPARPPIDRHGVLLGGNVSFLVYVIANPAPESWTYTLTTENGSTHDNNVDGVALSPSGNPGTLTIASVQPHHYGDYDVTVTNEKGQPLVMQLQLEKTGPPESPEEFKVNDVTCTSVTLQWRVGFSGGSRQTFHLSYRRSGATEWRTETVEDSGQDVIMHKVYEDIQELTSYEFKLFAQNADGSTEDKALRSTAKTTACPKFVTDSLVISIEDNIATISWEFTQRVDRVDVTCCNDPGVCTERRVDQPTAQQPITMEVPPGNQNYIFTFNLFQDGKLVFSMEKKHGPGSNLGVIIGIVVAVILVVAILVVIFVLFRKGVLPLKGADYSRSFEGELEAYAVATAKPRPNANANKPEKPKKSEKPEKPKKSAKPKKTDAPPVLVTDIYSEVQKPKKGPKPASGGAVGSTDTGPVLYAEVTKKPKNKEQTSQDGGAKSDSTPKDTDAGPVNGKVQKKPPAAENGKQAPNAKGYVNAAWTEGPEGPYSNVATHSGVAAAGGEGEGAYSEVAPKKKPGLLKSKPKAKPKPKAELPARAKGADNNNQGAAAPLVDEGVYQNVTSGGPAPVEDENFNPYSDVASEAHPEEPDAMVYADLSFAAAAAAAAAAAPGGGEGGGEGEGQPQKAPRIHRREEPTEYATVDFTRTGKYKAN